VARHFRKIDPRIWTDEKFVRLDAEGKLLALWLLTSSRCTRCGIVLWSAALAAEETGIVGHPPDTTPTGCRAGVDGVCDTVCDTMSWVFDRGAKCIFLTHWWRYNPPSNLSALKGAMRDLLDVPSNALKPALIKAKDDLPQYMHTVYDTVCDTVYDTVSPLEREKEKEKENLFPPRPAAERGVKKPAKKSAPTAPRSRTVNPLFDAIAEVTGAPPKAAGSFIAKVAAALAAEEPPFTAAEVREFGRRFSELCPWAAKDNRTRPELGELQKHVGKVRAQPPPAAAPRPFVEFDQIPPRQTE